MHARARWGAALALVLAVSGCVAPVPVAPTAPAATAPAAVGPRIEGTANLASGPFAGAAVKVFRLDTDALVGEGVTDAAGNFAVAVTPESAGFALRVEVAKDGKSLGALAGRSLSPTGRYRVAQTADSVILAAGIKVNLASTLALRAFVARLKAVSVSILPPNAKEIPLNLLAKLLASYKKAMDRAESSLSTQDLAALEASITQAGNLDAGLATSFGDLTTALNNELASLAQEGVDAGGQAPPSDLFAPPSGNDNPPPTVEPPTVDGVEPPPSGSAGPNGPEPTPTPGVTIKGDFSVPTPTTPPSDEGTA
ncbi:MAG: hypothetical protein ACK46X_10665 [Candidatus Sericytochromatia bacterium]